MYARLYVDSDISIFKYIDEKKRASERTLVRERANESETERERESEKGTERRLES